MLETIHISGEACFDATGQTLDDLKEINFLYGANGSGKTTVSRIIANEAGYPQCSVSWRNNSPMEVLAYNKDFVQRNFNPDKELQAIFTLGEQDEARIQEIENTKQAIDDLDKEIAGLRKTLEGQDGRGGKKAELARVEKGFEDVCWDAKGRFDADFKEAFRGVRDRKTKFKEKLVQEAQDQSVDLLSHEDLKEKAATVFAGDLNKEEKIPPLRVDALVELESADILSKKVIGKEDVDISSLIRS